MRQPGGNVSLAVMAPYKTIPMRLSFRFSVFCLSIMVAGCQTGHKTPQEETVSIASTIKDAQSTKEGTILMPDGKHAEELQVFVVNAN
jgi:hypothetical protein